MPAFRRLLPLLLLLVGSWPLAAAAQQETAQTTQNPHGALATPCASCHTADGWRVTRVPKGFQHAPGVFPLGGAHASTTCSACHRALDFSGTPRACASCHRDVHQGELGADCSRCHTDRGFVDRSVMTRQHQTTRFMLTGAHAAVDCEQCHQYAAQGRMQFVNTPTQCDQCHENRFLATRNPDHQAGGFPRQCTQCHATSLWTPARFNHEVSRFPLTGAHRAVQCDQCHDGNRFSGTPTACAGCHLATYQSTTNPPHQAANFPQECQQCHGTVTWDGAAFDHAATGFALSGAHVQARCDQCHANGRFAGTPVECAGCHLNDFQGAADPNHVAAAFPQTCQQCHSTVSWNGATFDHALSGFALTGAHRATACNLCHANNRYTGTPTDCFACHTADYQRPTNPNHVAAGFPTACASCHSTTVWTGATFNHSATSFPLTGAHVSRPCTDCHRNSVFAGTPTTCYGCHQGGYTSSVDPAHVAAALPTDCLQCHTTTVWDGARYTAHDATYFPIYSGAHAGRWSGRCSTCHTNPASYPTFTCLTCHQKPEMDRQHAGRTGYSYDSNACYRCHPRGNN